MLDCARIAEALGGRLTGASDVEVSHLSTPEAGGAGALCFLRRGVVVVPSCAALVVDEVRPGFEGPQIVVASVDAILPELFGLFAAPRRVEWGAMRSCGEGQASVEARVGGAVRVGPGALIGPGAVVEDGAALGAGVIVEPEAWIGAGAELASGAIVGWGCVIGARSRLGRGAIVGSEGFGFVAGERGARRIPHLGIVVIEEDVEVGAGSTVDRATLGETRIGAGSKLDNLVHVAHNVRIGRGAMIAAQSGIAGSAVLGDGVQLGGQVGVVGHLKIGSGARFSAQSGVTGDVPAGETWAGTPAMPISTWRRVVTAWRHLPEVLRRLRAWEGEGGRGGEGV